MAKDREKNAEYEEQIEVSDELEDGAVEEVEPAVPDRPTCPRCGWRNTRPSYSKNILDSVLRTFSLRPYRCRSCGNRFRVIRRPHRD
jgi:DNA-directed RNA polymerase subunit M/transcription elongation factor TFIIS